LVFVKEFHRPEVESTRVKLLYKDNFGVMLVGYINLLIIAWVIKDLFPQKYLILWNLIYLIVLGVRIFLVKRFWKSYRDKDIIPFEKYEKQYALGLFFTGITFASGIYFFYPQGHFFQQSFFGIIVAGTSAGAVSVYGSSKKTGYPYILLILTALLAKIFQEGEGFALPLILVFTLFAIVLYKGINATSNYIKNNIAMKVNREELIKQIITKNTELMKSNKELEENQKLIANSSRLAAVGEVSASIVHEINNPIMIILNYIQLSNKELAKEEINYQKIKGFLQKSENAVKRIDQIIKGLKNLSRDGSKDDFELVSLKDLFAETYAVCRDKLIKKNIQINICELSSDVQIFCQKVSIGQVIVNLINNAVDALVAAEIDQRWIKITVENNSKTLTLKVTDGGSGIDRSIADKIMEPFYTTKSYENGTGLGLSISRQIVNFHNGKLYIDEKCLNTCFVIELPHVSNKLTV